MYSRDKVCNQMYFEGQWWMAVETPKVLLVVYGKTPGEGLYQNKGQSKGPWDDSPGGGLNEKT